MEPKEIFKLAVRIVGLVCAYQGLLGMPIHLSDMIRRLSEVNLGGFLSSVFFAVWPLAVAYWLLSGAPLIMRIAYDVEPDESNTKTPVSGEMGRKVDASAQL